MESVFVIFAVAVSFCIGSPITKYSSVLIDENGDISAADVQSEIDGMTSVTLTNNNKDLRKLFVDDPVSSALLGTLRGSSLCIMTSSLPKKTSDSNPSCLKIGENIPAVDLSITVTQCDGKVMLPLEVVPCRPSAHPQKKSVQTSVSKLSRKRRSFFDTIRQALKSVGQTMSSGATDLGVKISAGTTDVGKKIAEAGKTSLDKTKSLVNKAKDAGAQIGQGAKKLVSGGVEGAKDLGKKAKDKITDFFG